jgi:3-methyladenine DNA glycosylase AlkD
MVSNYKDLIQSLQFRLAKVANKKIKDWWEKYLKKEIEFRGVNLVTIREELYKWYKEERINEQDADYQLALALSLFREKYAEDKLAGVLFLQDFLYKKIDWRILIPRFAELFTEGQIYDWNICDWFCVRVLGPMIKENGIFCAKAIAEWNSSKNVWQARASLVAFVNLAKDPKLTPIILDSSAVLIKRDERFAKTAVGWVLRELSKLDKNLVIGFIEEHREFFSKESLENSIKYFDLSEKRRLRSVRTSS